MNKWTNYRKHLWNSGNFVQFQTAVEARYSERTCQPFLIDLPPFITAALAFKLLRLVWSEFRWCRQVISVIVKKS